MNIFFKFAIIFCLVDADSISQNRYWNNIGAHYRKRVDPVLHPQEIKMQILTHLIQTDHSAALKIWREMRKTNPLEKIHISQSRKIRNLARRNRWEKVVRTTGET